MPFMHRWLIERSVLFFFFFLNIFGRFLYSYGVVFFTDFYRVFFLLPSFSERGQRQRSFLRFHSN